MGGIKRISHRTPSKKLDNSASLMSIVKPVKASKTSRASRKSDELKKRRATSYAPLAIGSLAASLTAKVARKKPQVKMLEIVAKNWREIVPQELVANFAEQTRPLKLVYVKTLKNQASEGRKSLKTSSTISKKKATLTIAVTKGFAPIAIHQLDQIISALNTYLGEEVIETIVLKQKNTLE